MKFALETEEEIKDAEKKVLVIATICFGMYLALSIWRFTTTEEYSQTLVNTNPEGVAKFYAETSAIVYANYAVLFAVATAMFGCACLGVRQRNRQMLQMFCCFDVCCAIAALIALIGVAFVGDLCVPAQTTPCSELRIQFAFSLLVSSVLIILYSCAWYWSYRLYKTREYFVVHREHTRGQVGTYTRPTQPQPDYSDIPVAQEVKL